MRLFDYHYRWLIGREATEVCCVLGAAGGRVPYHTGRLYSLRVFLFIVKLEILWTTGVTGRPTDV